MLGLASESKLKIDAVIEAFKTSDSAHLYEGYFFTDCESEVNEQPYGMEETLLGAENRLRNLKSKLLNKEKDCNILVSIENGVIPVGDIHIDLAFVIIELKNGTRFVSTSSGIVFDGRYVEEAKERGFYTNTVGSVISEQTGCASNDPHSFLTSNIFPRKGILRTAIQACIAQMMHYNGD